MTIEEKNIMKKTVSEEKQENCWTKLDQENIIKTLSVLVNSQKVYGKEYKIKDLFELFKHKLDKRFTAEQILYAIDKYTDLKTDIPTPADLILILTPKLPKITEAQYVAAQRAQERNGFPQFSSDAYVIKEYQAQNREIDNQILIENDKIKELVDNSVKKIGDK